MTKIYRLLLMAFVAVFLNSCDEAADVQDVDLDEIFSAESVDDVNTNVDAMEVKSVRFTPDYKQFSITTCVLRDIGPYAFSDTNLVAIKTTEWIGGTENDTRSKPVLKLIKNTEGDEVAKMGLKLLVLVDLTASRSLSTICCIG